ncbi:exo-beta-1,3-glucanase [Agrocybe pediades]|nr:exo-beta-1,3-glucanase [Agrocybe pediades]
MANPNTPTPTSNIPYDPLPLTNSDEPPSNSLYNAPPSPSYHTPQMLPSEIGTDEQGNLPAGAAQPRFLGAALYDGPGSNAMRDSFASSHHTFPGSEYNSSVYALNDPTRNNYDGGSYRDDPRDSYYAAGGVGAAMTSSASNRKLEGKRAAYAAPKARSRRKVLIAAGVAGVIIVIVIIVILVYVFAIKKPDNKANSHISDSSVNRNSASATATAKSGDATPAVRAAVTGGDGSTVTMEDGTTFVYKNPFGGYWYWDENDPFNNGARAQSWSPALNETFNYGVDKIRGVNFGGWLNTEPFSSPALYEKYLNNPTPAIDEWTLSLAMTADTAGGGINQLETHYKTFITEQDFAEVAGAGLNYIRIPIGYWAIEVRGDEPFLPKVSWTYFLKAIKWARKYGLRINLDLHGIPGSQNGWNHSGKFGTIGWLAGPMGYANAQRTLDYIRILAEFISQPQYKDVVTMFGIINEPFGPTIGQDPLSRFYMEAYQIIRNAGGVGKGPWISFHDGFFTRDTWSNFIPNADRIAVDTHPYLCFQGQSNNPMSSYAKTPCSSWGSLVNNSMASFGLTTAGEFSNAVTDCGLFLNGVNLGTRYEGNYTPGVWPRIGDCTPWTDWQNWDSSMKQDILNFALASMDALQDYFFWNWKIGNSSVSGKVETPAWSYKLGLENGWMPKDPRDAIGTCGFTSPWTPPLQEGSGNVPSSALNSLSWPPSSFKVGPDVSALPSYTPTGPIPTLPVPTFSAPSATATIDSGTGWTNSADTQGMYVEIPGCSYLDPWIDPSTAPPSPLCQ